MSTPDTFANTSQVRGRFRLPDPPRREPDEMTGYDQLHKTGNSYHLAQHFGNPERTLVAFGVDPAAYKASNGYVVSEQGKPPDFVLEVASESTAEIDVGEKRRNYAALGIGEYWRFDETGEHHGVRLAGERSVEGEYAAIDIEDLPDGNLQGYSVALNLNIRWEGGELRFYEPATGRPIATLADERARANAQQEARAAAEARVRELEEQIRRQGA